MIARLERHLVLTAGEREAITSAEHREVRLKPGEILMAEGGLSDTLFVVHYGWLHSSAKLSTGGRQILRFHYAGDLIGTSSIAWSVASATLTAVSDSTVMELPKVELGRIFRQQPRLAGLLYAIAAAENVAMSDRLTSIGRKGATERLTTLLLDILARLRVTAGGVIDSYDLPLTQSDIGDALGLTKVHVNRTIRALERDGVIERNGRRLRLIDPDSLMRQTGFVDRYGEIETAWLPAAP
ncbi:MULTISPECIES: Crp/Fnr family transcriptional regulator [unclassified Sphingomonas]|uniref:Crp/Fnr family transcriptional regulator n=1 Tax=Sphingomonas sp. 22R3R2A-7 TaxID=3050230 RepID=UPI002FDF348E